MLMRVGAFDFNDPLPELREPQAFAMLSPWVDVGRLGSSTLSQLEAHFHARDLGGLRRPGAFYDFTRYRPTLYIVDGRREIKTPNTFVKYARRETGNDLVFLHCLEPHMLGETFVESILKVLEKLGVRRYFVVGGMYDSVPHTRPLLVSGSATGSNMESELANLKVRQSGYEGPTSINFLVSQKAANRGIETVTLLVHLPHYAQLEEDYSGQHVLLNLLCSLCNFSVDLSGIKQRGEEQYREVGLVVEESPQAKQMVEAMQMSYDAALEEQSGYEQAPHLSLEVEKFLQEIDKGFGSN
ncbi:PAC2 family protein [Chloroflexota bacterium]